MKLCRHCQKVKPTRPRGLCWTCYHTPEVSERYPSTSKYAPGGGLRNRVIPICPACDRTLYEMAVGTLAAEGRSGVCSTCNRPEALRAAYHARIDEYQRRAELGLPLFDGEEGHDDADDV